MTAEEIHNELKIKTPVHKWWKREIATLSLSDKEHSLKEVKVHRGKKIECTFSKGAIKKNKRKIRPFMQEGLHRKRAWSSMCNRASSWC